MERNELLRRVCAAWDELEATVPATDSQRLSSVPPSGGWPARDHLAHIAVWLKVLAAHIERKSEHGTFGLEAAAYGQANVHVINHAAYVLNRDRVRDDVLAELRDMHGKAMALIAGLPEAEYARLIWPGRPESGQLSGDIAADTCERYLEHLAAVRSLTA
jgi:hypothetical protein